MNRASIAAIAVLIPSALLPAPVQGVDHLVALIHGADAGASVSGAKTVSGNFWPGGSIVYRIMLSNAGPGNQGDNPSDEFTDVLPPEVDLIGASSIAGLVASDPGSNTVTWNGPISAYTSVSIEITALIGSVPPGTSVFNQGTISYDGDGNGSNETQVGTDDPSLPGATDPTEFHVAPQEAIPTLKTTGLLILAWIMAGTGIVLLRSRVMA